MRTKNKSNAGKIQNFEPIFREELLSDMKSLHNDSLIKRLERNEKILMRDNAPYDSIFACEIISKGRDKIINNGYRVISLSENVDLRLNSSPYSAVNTLGNFVLEALLYVPRIGQFLIRKNPVFLGSQFDSKEEHGKYENISYTLTQEEAMKILQKEQSIKIKPKITSIPLTKLGEEELSIFSVGGGDEQRAKKYGEFLLDFKRTSLMFDVSEPRDPNVCSIKPLFFEGIYHWIPGWTKIVSFTYRDRISLIRGIK